MPSLASYVTQFMPSAIDALPLNEPLRFPLFIRIAGKWVEFRAVNDTLSKERLESLRKKIDVVFFPARYWLRYL